MLLNMAASSGLGCARCGFTITAVDIADGLPLRADGPLAAARQARAVELATRGLTYQQTGSETCRWGTTGATLSGPARGPCRRTDTLPDVTGTGMVRHYGALPT